MQLNAPSAFLREFRTGRRASGFAGSTGSPIRERTGSIDPYPPRPRTWMGRWLWGLDFRPP